MSDHQTLRMGRALAMTACAVGLALASSVVLAAPRYVIAAPGSTADWTEKLGVQELWVGCSSEPDRCMKSLDAYARADGINRVTLSIASDPKLIADYALHYSEASLSEPRLHAVVLDDTVPVFIREQKAGVAMASDPSGNRQRQGQEPEAFVRHDAVRRRDEFCGSEGRCFPPATRAQVDRVSLFVHFRKNGPQYASYVPQAKKLFPNAAIVAGVYAYDRSDYMPCAEGSKDKCTRLQDLALFEQTLRVQVGMVDAGQVAGIQFWPGTFGKREQTWSGWDSPGACSQRQECVNATVAMHDAVLKALH